MQELSKDPIPKTVKVLLFYYAAIYHCNATCCQAKILIFFRKIMIFYATVRAYGFPEMPRDQVPGVTFCAVSISMDLYFYGLALFHGLARTSGMINGGNYQ
jgi:hypothetical protein